MLEMWDVGDEGCSGCGMFRMWDVRDVGCSGCGMFGMWDVGCLLGCGMLIYKMPRPESFGIYRGKNRQEKNKCFGGKNKTKLTLEWFACSPDLIILFNPQMYLSGRNLYIVLEDALFYLQSGFEILLMSFICL